MTTSAVSNLRNKGLVLLLALILTGCIQPDAPYPDGSAPIGTLTPIFPPTAGATGNSPLATQPLFGPTPTEPGAGPATIAPTQAQPGQGTPEPVSFVWRYTPIGPEQVAFMFYIDPSGNRCARYIFRNKVIERCPQPGQMVVPVTGVEVPADGKVYTIVAGRVLDSRISVVTAQFREGNSQPIQVSAGGFAVILEGVHSLQQVSPIDQNGNLVGPIVPL